MTPDRSIATAIMEGINCIAEIASVLDEGIGSVVNHSWLDSLRTMEQAFAAIQAGEVATSMVISDQLVERVRDVRELVSNWLNGGNPPNGLKGQVDAVLAFFGLPLAEEGNQESKDGL